MKRYGASSADYLLAGTFIFSFLGCQSRILAQVNAGAVDSSKRAVTVADTIRMTKFGDPAYEANLPSRDRVAVFSPDGTQFVTVIRKGNLEENTNEYSLLLWQTNDLFTSSTIDTILTMSTSSNRPAIANIKWTSDGPAITFLGERPGETQQLYILKLSSRAVERLTSHSSEIISYDVTPSRDTVAFTAAPRTRSFFDQNTQRTGVVVSNEFLPDLLLDHAGGRGFGRDELFVQRGRNEVQLVAKDVGLFNATPQLSPDGRYVLANLYLKEIPADWSEYTEKYVHIDAETKLKPGQYSFLQEWSIIDSVTGRVGALLQSPSSKISSEARWSADGKSVILAGVYLPLQGATGVERKRRQETRVVAEVSIPDMHFTEVTDEDLAIVDWNANAGKLTLRGRYTGVQSDVDQKITFQKTSDGWHRVPKGAAQATRPDIMLEEDMNTPPRIVAVDRSTNHRAILLELNPQFSKLRLGKVEEITWKSRSGAQVKGGLYYPADYAPGIRYPLVIQTHGWRSERFLIDGPWASGFAAQPLAGKGIMVLQDGGIASDLSTSKELDTETGSLEAAIDLLDQRGLIDRRRIALFGFSRTCWHVEYALTHSKYRFAAASIMDGVDGGYWQYLEIANSRPGDVNLFETINGGQPWGDGLQLWRKISPGFNLDKVQTPVRIIAEDPGTVLGEWELYSGLRRLGKPVEMITMRDGTHILQRPWERMIAQQGNVDWFDFWLNGHEDPDPAKANQYARWRELRRLQEASQSLSHQ